MRTERGSTWLYLFLVFAGGAATGVFADRLFEFKTVSADTARPTPEAWKKRYMGELKTRVKLDDQQLERVRVILDETHQRANKVRAEMQVIHDDQARQVRGVLNEDQKPAYEKLTAEREELRKKMYPGMQGK